MKSPFTTLLMLPLLLGSLHLQANEDEILTEYLSMEGIHPLTQQESKRIIDQQDWKAATNVTLDFEDNAYFPESLTLESGMPYILNLVNVGNRSHDMAGEEFLSSMVIKEIRTSGFKVKTYHVESIHLRPQQEVTIWMVPIKKGEFPEAYTRARDHSERPDCSSRS